MVRLSHGPGDSEQPDNRICPLTEKEIQSMLNQLQVPEQLHVFMKEMIRLFVLHHDNPQLFARLAAEEVRRQGISAMDSRTASIIFQTFVHEIKKRWERQ